MESACTREVWKGSDIRSTTGFLECRRKDGAVVGTVAEMPYSGRRGPLRHYRCYGFRNGCRPRSMIRVERLEDLIWSEVSRVQLARCEYVDRRENVIAVGNSGTGKTHVALGLGLAACQRGLSAGFTTAASLVHELIEAKDERRLLNLRKKLARLRLLIIDEPSFVPLSKTGAEILFEVFSQRYERGSVLVTTNLPFDEWTEVFGSERLTGALLDRLTHRVHILEMNGESYRLKQSRLAATTRSAGGSTGV